MRPYQSYSCSAAPWEAPVPAAETVRHDASRRPVEASILQYIGVVRHWIVAFVCVRKETKKYNNHGDAIVPRCIVDFSIVIYAAWFMVFKILLWLLYPESSLPPFTTGNSLYRCRNHPPSRNPYLLCRCCILNPPPSWPWDSPSWYPASWDCQKWLTGGKTISPSWAHTYYYSRITQVLLVVISIVHLKSFTLYIIRRWYKQYGCLGQIIKFTK